MLVAASGCGGAPHDAAVPTAPAADLASSESLAPSAVPATFSTTPLPIPAGPLAATPVVIPPDVPRDLALAATLLGETGLGDPRGAEYREVTIATGSVWGGVGPAVATRAWVIPDVEREGLRYAIAWNGLTYAVASVGAPADLGVDLHAITAGSSRDDESQATALSTTTEPVGDETISVLPGAYTGIASALLVRLGRFADATALWRAGGDAVSSEGSSARVAGVVADFAWLLFERTVCAHMRGDDGLALAGARVLVAGRERWREATSSIARDERDPLEFLRAIDELLADQERRGSEPRQAALDPTTIADPDARIHAWIESLDEIDERQWGQPGWVRLDGAAAVRALADEGGRAIEPLLAVVRDDTRLTRSVHFWRDFARHRSLLGVHEAALAALEQILEHTFFEPAATGDDLSARGASIRARLAGEIRAFVERTGGPDAGVRRHLAILADDDAGVPAWIEAASAIIDGEGGMTLREAWGLASAPSVTPRGEILRTETDPSVTELVDRRLRAAIREGDRERGTREYGAACVFAGLLARWDPARHAPQQAELFDRCSARGADCGTCFAAVALREHVRGDSTAIDRYARALVASTPSSPDVDSLEPILFFPDDPAMSRLVDALLGTSLWTDVIAGRRGRGEVLWARTEAYRVPALREYALRVLADRTGSGSFHMEEDRRAVYGFGAGSTRIRFADVSTDLPPPGSVRDLRRCDELASRLRATGVSFELYWDMPRRDAAIREMDEWIRDRAAEGDPDPRP